MKKIRLNIGDIAEVISPSDIYKTLDSKGTLDNLPYMPEMIQYCGKKFRIVSMIGKTCVECLLSNNSISGNMREFNLDDVVFLEDLRCTGDSHENCQVGCMIFWKVAWLRKPNNKYGENSLNKDGEQKLRELLKTKENNGKYFCQSTQLASSTIPISINKRFLKLIEEVISKEINIYTAFKSIINPGLRKFKKLKSKTILKGNLKRTPVDVLNLKPGELVDVKTLDEILETLDNLGRNKGLEFNFGMREYCGKKFRVRNRLDRMINEVTGEMKEIKNTVILEGITCTYDYKGFGCPRSRFRFWKEIWLRRINS